MLPQMMPLPWLVIFLLIFLCACSIFLYFSFFSFNNLSPLDKQFKSHSISLPW